MTTEPFKLINYKNEEKKIKRHTKTVANYRQNNREKKEREASSLRKYIPIPELLLLGFGKVGKHACYNFSPLPIKKHCKINVTNCMLRTLMKDILV